MTWATTTIQSRPDPGKHSRGEWQAHAACHSADPTIFTSSRSRTKAWVAICATCRVSECCLWAAMLEEADSEYRYAIRGGCCPARREKIARSLPPAADFYAALQAAVEAWAATT